MSQSANESNSASSTVNLHQDLTIFDDESMESSPVPAMRGCVKRRFIDDHSEEDENGDGDGDGDGGDGDKQGHNLDHGQQEQQDAEDGQSPTDIAVKLSKGKERAHDSHKKIRFDTQHNRTRSEDRGSVPGELSFCSSSLF